MDNLQKVLNGEIPWHTERWYIGDITGIMEEEGIELTDDNIKKALVATRKIFDDLSGRNEILKEVINSAFF